jgi:hypothetical protein
MSTEMFKYTSGQDNFDLLENCDIIIFINVIHTANNVHEKIINLIKKI